MEGDSWGLAYTSSKQQQTSAIRSRLDSLRLEEVNGEENEARTGYACPFCYEEFDIIGLCFHVDDEHPVEAKRGVCPLCPESVGLDLVGHIMTEHENFYKMQHRRSQKGSSASQTMLSLLRKNLQEGNIQYSFGGSSFTSTPSNSTPDPLLSSFILNVHAIESLKEEHKFFEEGCEINKLVEEVESFESSISLEYQKERALRNEFVQGLVLSTIFDDTL